jgi:hypothetical protein
MSHRGYTAIGTVLVVAALAGFLTVADDIRHTGEFFAVAGVFVSGLAFLGAGVYPQLSTVVALQWLPPGVALGFVCGAAADRVAVGVCSGAALGVLLAWFRRERSA